MKHRYALTVCGPTLEAVRLFFDTLQRMHTFNLTWLDEYCNTWNANIESHDLILQDEIKQLCEDCGVQSGFVGPMH